MLSLPTGLIFTRTQEYSVEMALSSDEYLIKGFTWLMKKTASVKFPSRKSPSLAAVAKEHEHPFVKSPQDLGGKGTSQEYFFFSVFLTVKISLTSLIFIFLIWKMCIIQNLWSHCKNKRKKTKPSVYTHTHTHTHKHTEKYRSMEQDRKPKDKPSHLWSPNLWQRRQEYTMEKSQSL